MKALLYLLMAVDLVRILQRVCRELYVITRHHVYENLSPVFNTLSAVLGFGTINGMEDIFLLII